MKTNRTFSKPILVRGAALVAAVGILAGLQLARAQGTDNRAPDVPYDIRVGDGYKVHYHAFAVGDQIYTWTLNPTNAALGSWTLVAPDAVLMDSEGNVVGTHYAGPTWESNSGSKVRGARIAGVMVDQTAIPWLLLGSVTNSGNGIFSDIKRIQRVNTIGGLPPRTPGTAGQIVRSPYYAEYYFFREEN